MLTKVIDFLEQQALIITQVNLARREEIEIYTICAKDESIGYTYQLQENILILLNTSGRHITRETIKNFNFDETSRLEMMRAAVQNNTPA